jgi:hypothetical protein
VRVTGPSPLPLTLSLSKGRPSFFRLEGEGQGFDKLSLSGFGEVGSATCA